MLGKVVADNQKDWDTRLPFVMAAYRASRHESTGYSPNLLTLGRETRAPVDIVLNLPDPDGPHQTYDGFVEKLQEKMKQAYTQVREHIGQAAERNKKYYDLRVRSRKYKVGDWVYYFNPRHFRGKQDKWSRKYSGPFLVIAVTSAVNVTLQKSPRAKPFTVHIDKVKPFLSETPRSWLQEDNSVEPEPDLPTNELTYIQEDSSSERPEEEPKRSRPGQSRDSDLDKVVRQRQGQPVDSKSPSGANHDFEVDPGPQPRPRREIRIPARYRD